MNNKNKKRSNKTANKKVSMLSLFTGAGGLDIGFHKAGFRATAFNEIESRFCQTLEANPKYFKSGVIINKDITELSTDEIPGPIEFIVGGPPCQSFSASGKRLGLDDDRGVLFKHYIRLLNHFQPRGFLFENVRGILYANGGRAIEEIKNSFEKEGYNVEMRLLNAADYGVPQLRERVFLLGSRDKKLFFPSPTHGPDSKNKKPFVTIWDSIKDVYNKKEKEVPFGGKYGDLLPLVPEGHNYSYFTERMGYPNPIFGWRTKFSNFLYKVDRNKPCRTIQAQAGKYSGPFHWKNRKLNTEELKRVQTFPKDFIFPCGHTTAAQQIGNSVPPRIAYVLAKCIINQLNNEKIHPDNLIDESFRFSFDKRKGIKARETRRTGIKNLAKKYG